MKARQKKRKVQRRQQLSNHNQYSCVATCFNVHGQLGMLSNYMYFYLSLEFNTKVKLALFPALQVLFHAKPNPKTLTLLNKLLKGGTANGDNPAGALPRGGGGGDDFCSINYLKTETKTKTGGGKGQGEGEGVVRVLGGRGHRRIHQEPLGPLDVVGRNINLIFVARLWHCGQ